MVRMFAVASSYPQWPRSGASMPMKRMCSPLSRTIVSPSITWVTTAMGTGATEAAVLAGGSVFGGDGGAVGGRVRATVGAATVVAGVVVGACVDGVTEVAGAALVAGSSVAVAAADVPAAWTAVEPSFGA